MPFLIISSVKKKKQKIDRINCDEVRGIQGQILWVVMQNGTSTMEGTLGIFSNITI